MSETEGAKDQSTQLIIGLIGLFVATCICCGLWGDMGGGDGDREPDELDAYLACQGFMNDRLRAPATAKYPLLTSVDWARESNVWGFEAYVDAENAFGAKLRTRFNCRVRWDAEAELWRLENLETY